MWQLLDLGDLLTDVIVLQIIGYNDQNTTYMPGIILSILQILLNTAKLYDAVISLSNNVQAGN